MFKYTEDIEKRLRGGYIDIALTTNSEEEMFELMKIKNPFVNRNLAKNENVTKKVLNELLDNYAAYTMCIYIAKNKNIDDGIKDKLFNIGETVYKDSLLTSDLESIFKLSK